MNCSDWDSEQRSNYTWYFYIYWFCHILFNYDCIWHLGIEGHLFTALLQDVFTLCSNFSQACYLVYVDSDLWNFRVVIYVFIIVTLFEPYFILECSAFTQQSDLVGIWILNCKTSWFITIVSKHNNYHNWSFHIIDTFICIFVKFKRCYYFRSYLFHT